MSNRICGPCNNQIGREVEEQFLRTTPIAFYRAVLGLKRGGKDRSDLFYRGSHGAQPILIFGPPPGELDEILWEIVPGTMKVFPARQLILRHKDGNRVPLLLTDHMAIPASLQAVLEDGELCETSVEGVYVLEKERDWAMQIARQVSPDFAPRWLDARWPEQKVPLQIVTRFTNRLHRAVAKMAFHFVLKVFQDIRGDEPEFAPLRDFVINGGDEGRFVSPRKISVIGNLRIGMSFTRWTHVLIAKRDGNGVTCHCCLFGGRQAVPLEISVAIGRDPSTVLRPRPEVVAQEFVYCEDGPSREGFDGEAKYIPSTRVTFPML